MLLGFAGSRSNIDHEPGLRPTLLIPKHQSDQSLPVLIGPPDTDFAEETHRQVISQRYFGRDLMPLWHRNGRAIRALEAAHQWAEQRRRDAEAGEGEASATEAGRFYLAWFQHGRCSLCQASLG